MRDLSSSEPFEGASAPNEALESLLSKGSARGSLEILLKFGRTCSVPEGDGGFDVPWPILGGVRYLPGIVTAESVVEVVGQLCVEMFGAGLALEDVNVDKIHSGLACRVVVRSA